MIKRLIPWLGPIPWVIRKERHSAGLGVDLGFRDEFRAGAVSPVAEKDRGKRSFAFWYHEISIYRPTFWAGISDVMKGAVGELSDDLVLEIQWLFGVVVEEVDQRLEVSLSFSRCGDQGSESDKSKQFAHRSFGFGKVRLSVSVIKSGTTAVPAFEP